jgi:3alpha(or 20beta)-hydroxysteroid dehydrogenase
VDNAGVLHQAEFIDHTFHDFRRLIDINTIGVFLSMQTVAPAMTAQESGSIVNISAITARVGAPNSIGYGASRFAITGMIETKLFHEVASHDDARLEKLANSTPCKRSADPKEIDMLALFPGSDESSFNSGTGFVADGAVTAV